LLLMRGQHRGLMPVQHLLVLRAMRLLLLLQRRLRYMQLQSQGEARLLLQQW
jgi:hypothetical protein